ncbi:MAG: hypothetical protein AAGA77_16020 [Bacteroidota bacterium]
MKNENEIMFIKVHENQIKEITEFLIKHKVIFHPIISPTGIPDFTNYKGRKFILILDRNILVLILDLVQAGTLNDPHKLKLVSSLLFWCDLNQITPTSGFALMEHSHVQGNSLESGIQHNIFQSIYKKYSPNDWLELALGIKSSIPIIDDVIKSESEYLVYNEHQTLNYLQVLKICQLYFIKNMNREDKLVEFYNWSYENLIIGMYSTFYAIMFFSSRTKLEPKILSAQPEELFEKCKNVAWDLTYLSYWSTLFWNDKKKKKVFLFSTRDKEIKELFSLLHSDPQKAYTKALGKKLGEKIKKKFESIHKSRPKRTFEKKKLEEKVFEEETRLTNLRENAI